MKTNTGTKEIIWIWLSEDNKKKKRKKILKFQAPGLAADGIFNNKKVRIKE